MNIWKYTIEDGETTELPEGARILRVDTQHGCIRAWAEVDPAAKTELVRFLVIPTGGQVPPFYAYVGTVMSGPFVWHVYRQ